MLLDGAQEVVNARSRVHTRESLPRLIRHTVDDKPRRRHPERSEGPGGVWRAARAAKSLANARDDARTGTARALSSPMRWTPGGVSSDIEDRRGSSGFGIGGAPMG